MERNDRRLKQAEVEKGALQPYVREINSLFPDIIESIVKIDTDAFNQCILSWQIEAFGRFGKVFGVFVDKSIVGDAQFLRDWEKSGTAYLAGMAVYTKFQNKGLGTLLLQQALADLKEDNVKTVYLHVDPNNARAIHLYLNKMHFTTEEFRKNEYGLGNDRIFMKLSL